MKTPRTWFPLAGLALSHLVSAALALSFAANPLAALLAGTALGYALALLLRRLLPGDTEAARAHWLRQAQAAAAQQERHRLARDLHDSIKQQLFAIQTGAAAAQAHTNPEAVRTALADVRQSAHAALVEMHALLQQLQPDPLVRVGLAQALRDQGEALAYRTDARVSVDCTALPPDAQMPPGTPEALFRIAQEALSNIARHARATQVQVTLAPTPARTQLVLTLTDDGQGFDPRAPRTGLGLANLQARVAALAGQVTLTSTLGAGTTIKVAVPLMEETEMEPNHTLNKVLGLGLLGGLGLLALLWYPLYVVWPAAYTAGWSGGDSTLALLCEGLALALVVALGYVAARIAGPTHRTAGAAWGALASLLACVSAFGVLGDAAIGVHSSAPMLAHGLVYDPGDMFITLLVYSVVGAAWWSHLMFWVTLIAGAGLGALGGFLVRPSGTPAPSLRRAWITTLFVLALSSTLTILSGAVIFGILAESTQRTMGEHTLAFMPQFPVAGVSIWPLLTPFIFYVAALAGLAVLLRRECAEADPERRTIAEVFSYVLAGLTVAWPFSMLAFIPSVLLNDLLPFGVLFAMLANFTLGALHFANALGVYRRWHAATRPWPQHALRVLALYAGVGVACWLVASQIMASLVGLLTLFIGLIALWYLTRGMPINWMRQGVLVERGLNAVLGIVAALVIPNIASIGASLTMIYLPVVFIAPLAGTNAGPTTQTLSGIVQDLYLGHAQAMGWLWVSGLILAGLALPISGALITLLRNTRARAAQASA